jgi:hypothetical protein
MSRKPGRSDLSRCASEGETVADCPRSCKTVTRRRHAHPNRRTSYERTRFLQTALTFKPPTVRYLTAWLQRTRQQLTAEQTRFLTHLSALSPEVRETQAMAVAFRRLLQGRRHAQFPAWLAQAERRPVPEMRSFAAGLRQHDGQQMETFSGRQLPASPPSSLAQAQPDNQRQQIDAALLVSHSQTEWRREHRQTRPEQTVARSLTEQREARALFPPRHENRAEQKPGLHKGMGYRR